MPSVVKFTPMKNWKWGTVNMIDRTCTECEGLWEAYDYATYCKRIIEHKAAMETGLEGLVRKASNRCEAARKAVEGHEATHMTATLPNGRDASGKTDLGGAYRLEKRIHGC